MGINRRRLFAGYSKLSLFFLLVFFSFFFNFIKLTVVGIKMIILIGLLLSAIIVAPELIQQEQKAARNAEQARELDQYGRQNAADIANILKLHNVERSATNRNKDNTVIANHYAAYNGVKKAYLDICKNYRLLDGNDQWRPSFLTNKQQSGLRALCRLDDF